MNWRLLPLRGLGLLLMAIAWGCAEEVPVQLPVAMTSSPEASSSSGDSVQSISATQSQIDSTQEIPTSQTPSTHLPPIRLTFADWFSPDYHQGTNNNGNIVVFRSFVPWSVFDVQQLARLTVPYTTHSAGTNTDDLITEQATGPTGLGDIELYDVSEIPMSWGEIQLGPVFDFPTGTRSGVGKDKWTAGPAIGANTRSDNWRLGIFTLGYFSFAGDSNQASIAKEKFQPIIDYSLPHGWSVGTSTMNFTYDWTKGAMTNVPLGIEIGKSFEVASQNWRLSGEAEYNFASTPGSAAWTFRFTLEYTLPDRR